MVFFTFPEDARWNDERGAVDHPRVHDVLARIALELAEHRADRDRASRDDRADVRVDQVRHLVAVRARERPQAVRIFPASR